LDGKTQPVPPVGPRRLRECRWEPALTLIIPPDWPSGVYLGRLTTLPGKDTPYWQSYVVIVVREDRACRYPPPGECEHLVGSQPWLDEGYRIGGQNVDLVNGGGDWICTLPDHWIFEVTGMKQGDAIPGLVGWEYHGDPPKDIPG